MHVKESQNNDFLSAYGELSSASNSLFAIISDPNNRTSAIEQLMPQQTQIAQTQQALFQGNLTKALNSLDTTELELQKWSNSFHQAESLLKKAKKIMNNKIKPDLASLITNIQIF
jgi:hypothetical protein